jgi:NAD(P)H dehydrogenase (quinone)
VHELHRAPFPGAQPAGRRDAAHAVVLDDEDYVAWSVGNGVPEGAARMFLTLFRAAREGEFAVTDPTLATLLGREPQGVRSVMEAGPAH